MIPDLSRSSVDERLELSPPCLRDRVRREELFAADGVSVQLQVVHTQSVEGGQQ